MKALSAAFSCLVLAAPATAQGGASGGSERFRAIDVFGLEYASDPRISPDARSIAYVRNFMDIMKDRRRSSLWLIGRDGEQRPLTTGNRNDASPRWSPDGSRLLYVATDGGTSQLWVRWLDTGQTAKLTQLTRSPSGLAWSPDGKWIAFTMLVPEKRKPFAEMPPKPEGAEWAEPPRVVAKLRYRSDGAGYLEDGYRHVFVVPAGGGTPRQVTTGAFHHNGTPSWTPDGAALVFSANRHPDWRHEVLNTEVYEVRLADGGIRALTSRDGPDESPVVSPQGDRIAYVGFDDRVQGYQTRRLWVMARDGSSPRLLTAALDRDVVRPVWSGDGKSVWFQYDERGRTRVARVTLSGEVESYVSDVGGVSLGRPYSGGSFTVAGGRFAYTRTDAGRPADVAVGEIGKTAGKRLTSLNEDLLAHKELAAAEELVCRSSHDGREIQAWILKPPGFDPKRKYPLILEIHGGPFANYGFRFAAELQLYAAADYVVLYVNPRGSTSYGGEFANLIHHNYPGEDYDDLMSAVDATIARGYVDPKRLFVTGGSGGGVLTSWIVGKTHRFRAAAVQKPVINWYSFVLTADAYAFFTKYWFPGFPWDHPEHYMKRSPLSLVGNVKTPTMLITGEVDYRTPMSESEQYYQALQLRKIDTLLVRIPGASHGIARRPSQLIAKVQHVLAWFEKYD